MGKDGRRSGRQLVTGSAEQVKQMSHKRKREVHLPGSELIPGSDEAGWKLAHGTGDSEKESRQESVQAQPKTMSGKGG